MGNPRVLVLNNSFLLAAPEWADAEILFAPIYHSALQRRFWETRFQELRSTHPRTVWCENIGAQDFDLALAWDALYEREAFGPKLHPRQNRLFDHIPFPIGDGFTPFRRLAEELLPARYEDAIPPRDREAQRELDYYFREAKLASTYFDTRNAMIGRDGSTRFSVFLSSGVLDVRHLYNEVREFERLHGANKSTGWIVFELLWREFFYWHYQANPRSYFSLAGLRGPAASPPVPLFPLEYLRGLPAHPLFAACLRELTGTGFLHNRTRQIFASIWLNDLGLDWRAGARLFEEHLLDYDVYSNYGNWMYLAGVGVDPRGKRYFNVDKQLRDYDPAGGYLAQWSPDAEGPG